MCVDQWSCSLQTNMLCYHMCQLAAAELFYPCTATAAGHGDNPKNNLLLSRHANCRCSHPTPIVAAQPTSRCVRDTSSHMHRRNDTPLTTRAIHYCQLC